MRLLLLLTTLSVACDLPAQERPPALLLPTANEAIFANDGEGFYQFVDRSFEGSRSTPWEGGKFGFVRDPRRMGSRIAYARFHEGLDIKPVRRGEGGEPLDDVMSMAEGSVVHVSANPAQSNYGRYIVVEHDWGSGPFYALYAHLNAVQASPGDAVRAGQVLGRLGYTGAGIDKRRAHLHVELTMLWSKQFQAWYDRGFSTPNHHGIYNGQNLIGLDLAALLLASRKDPQLTMSAFVRQTPPYFEVTVPGSARMEILQRHPWLLDGSKPASQPVSWAVTFSAWGQPVRVRAGASHTAEPLVTAVQESPLPHALNSRNLITGSGREAKLTAGGLSFIKLACGL